MSLVDMKIGFWIMAIGTASAATILAGCAEKKVYVQSPPPAVVAPPPVVVTPPPARFVAPPPVVVTPPPAVVVSQPPPPPIREVRVAAPGPAYVWVPGYWSWQGRWVWVSGAWRARPHAHAHWIAGHWAPRGHGYVWVGGYWH